MLDVCNSLMGRNSMRVVDIPFCRTFAATCTGRCAMFNSATRCCALDRGRGMSG